MVDQKVETELHVEEDEVEAKIERRSLGYCKLCNQILSWKAPVSISLTTG